MKVLEKKFGTNLYAMWWLQGLVNSAAQVCSISTSALGKLLADDLWEFEIFCVMSLFVSLRLYQINILITWFKVNAYFCWGVRSYPSSWVQSHGPCIHMLLMPSETLDNKAPVNFLGWRHFPWVVTNNCWEN